MGMGHRSGKRGGLLGAPGGTSGPALRPGTLTATSPERDQLHAQWVLWPERRSMATPMRRSEGGKGLRLGSFEALGAEDSKAERSGAGADRPTTRTVQPTFVVWSTWSTSKATTLSDRAAKRASDSDPEDDAITDDAVEDGNDGRQSGHAEGDPAQALGVEKTPTFGEIQALVGALVGEHPPSISLRATNDQGRKSPHGKNNLWRRTCRGQRWSGALGLSALLGPGRGRPYCSREVMLTGGCP